MNFHDLKVDLNVYSRSLGKAGIVSDVSLVRGYFTVRWDGPGNLTSTFLHDGYASDFESSASSNVSLNPIESSDQPSGLRNPESRYGDVLEMDLL